MFKDPTSILKTPFDLPKTMIKNFPSKEPIMKVPDPAKLTYDPNLNENLPIFDEMIINFDNVLIDPLQDPMVLYENQFLQKGEISK
jgi:hypothetical protein